jgi:hypothetical protein
MRDFALALATTAARFARLSRCRFTAKAALAAALLTIPAAAQAAVTFTFDAARMVAQGSSVTFNGSLTNTGPNEVFLNGISITMGGAGLTPDDSPFFVNVPLSLSPGESTGLVSMLDVFADLTAPTGTFLNSITIQGGANNAAQDELGFQGFLITVTSAETSAVPEPATWAMMLFGFGVIGGATRYRRRKEMFRLTA